MVNAHNLQHTRWKETWRHRNSAKTLSLMQHSGLWQFSWYIIAISASKTVGKILLSCFQSCSLTLITMRRSNLPWNQTYPFSGKCQAQCHNLMWFCTLIWGLLSTVLLVRSDDCLIQNDFDWLQNSKPNRQALSGRQQMSPTSWWHGHHDGYELAQRPLISTCFSWCFCIHNDAVLVAFCMFVAATDIIATSAVLSVDQSINLYFRRTARDWVEKTHRKYLQEILYTHIKPTTKILNMHDTKLVRQTCKQQCDHGILTAWPPMERKLKLAFAHTVSKLGSSVSSKVLVILL